MDNRMSQVVPVDPYYLASHYWDRFQQLETWRVYCEDGRVEAFNGQEWWTVCRFSPEQVARAKAVIRSSGLLDATDLTDSTVYDAAQLTYHWRLDSAQGSVTNWAYPACTHPVFEIIDRQLDALETEAGSDQRAEEYTTNGKA
jgi:hypothetical protein